MRRAILSDIHGNLEALEAVLADIDTQQIDEIYCLGDIVGYGPNPRECIDRVMTFQVVVLGNHDQGALFDPEGFSSGAERAIFWTRDQLEGGDNPEAAQRRWDFLAELPRAVRQQKRLFVHGSPRNPLNEYVFPEDVYNTKKLEKLFSLVDHVSFQGHTHVPGVFTEDLRFYHPGDIGERFTLGERKAMVNVGSVGQPRDRNPAAAYALFDRDRQEITFFRIVYDAASAAERIRDCGLPGSLAYRVELGI